MGGLTTVKEQKAFEKGLWEKIRRGGGEFQFGLRLLCVRSTGATSSQSGMSCDITSLAQYGSDSIQLKRRRVVIKRQGLTGEKERISGAASRIYLPGHHCLETCVD
jgi:hypothetical protein